MKKNKKGFTLVELVIVVAVMAVLVAVAIPTVGSITGRAQTAVFDSNCRTIESVIKLAEAEAAKDGDGTTTLEASAIYEALNDAKLGIEKATTFYYHADTGIVNGTALANGEKGCKIVFEAGVASDGTKAPDPSTPAATNP